MNAVRGGGGVMVLEEQVLQALEQAPRTYDALRAEIGALPAELDRAIARLQASRQIVRNGAKFARVNGTAQEEATPRIAAASAEPAAAASPATKVCSKCEKRKPREAFSKKATRPDGLQCWCKDCVKMDNIARAARAHPKEAKPVTKPVKRATRRGSNPAPPVVSKPAPPPSPPALTGQSAPIVLLHFHDGVRLGVMVTGASGLSQMAYHVDLSAAQLDELCRWWTAARETGAHEAR